MKRQTTAELLPHYPGLESKITELDLLSETQVNDRLLDLLVRVHEGVREHGCGWEDRVEE